MAALRSSFSSSTATRSCSRRSRYYHTQGFHCHTLISVLRDCLRLQGVDPSLVDQWAEALRANPPELRRALAVVAETKAQLMKARRELRNQAIEKQQIDEHLASMTGLQDVEVELTELLGEKQRQMEGYVAQLQRERAERAGLEEELRRSRQREEELATTVAKEQEMARQLITQAKKEAKKLRRLAMKNSERGGARGSGGGDFDAATSAAWLRTTTICRDQVNFIL